jgi:hypothetical protein
MENFGPVLGFYIARRTKVFNFKVLAVVLTFSEESSGTSELHAYNCE